MRMMMGLLGDVIKNEFPIFAANPDMVYLDNASTTHKPLAVIDAMSDYQSSVYSNIHRGSYHIAEESERLYKESKKKIADFIGGDFREIIYTYNATYASNILAQSLVQTYNIGPDDCVFVGIRDHHATIVPRQLLSEQYGFQVKFIGLNKDTLDIDREACGSLIDQFRPKVVICSHVSNVTGIVYDMHRLARLISSVSDTTIFAIDGSQAVPHMQINVNILGCDAYFFTGHKMLGPTGIGVLWIKKTVVRSLKTMLGGGGIIESVTTDGCSLIRTADKFEPGTPNLIGAVGLGAACDFYKTHDIYAYLGSYELMLSHDIQKGLANNPRISLISGGLSLPSCGIVSLAVSNPGEFAEYLADNNICVRGGGHCAHPLLHMLGYDKGVVRISPFLYTTGDDVTRLVDVINRYTG